MILEEITEAEEDGDRRFGNMLVSRISVSLAMLLAVVQHAVLLLILVSSSGERVWLCLGIMDIFMTIGFGYCAMVSDSSMALSSLWIVYGVSLSTKCGVLYFKAIYSIMVGGCYVVFFISPIILVLLGYRARSSSALFSFSNQLISTDGLLHYDMLFHMAIDLLDLMTGFLTAPYPALSDQPVSPPLPAWIDIFRGIVVISGTAIIAFSFPAFAGKPIKFKKNKYFSESDMLSNDIFVTYKVINIAGIFLIDGPLLVVRIAAMISRQSFKLNLFVFKNAICLPYRAFRLHQLRLAERIISKGKQVKQGDRNPRRRQTHALLKSMDTAHHILSKPIFNSLYRRDSKDRGMRRDVSRMSKTSASSLLPVSTLTSSYHGVGQSTSVFHSSRGRKEETAYEPSSHATYRGSKTHMGDRDSFSLGPRFKKISQQVIEPLTHIRTRRNEEDSIRPSHTRSMMSVEQPTESQVANLRARAGSIPAQSSTEPNSHSLYNTALQQHHAISNTSGSIYGNNSTSMMYVGANESMRSERSSGSTVWPKKSVTAEGEFTVEANTKDPYTNPLEYRIQQQHLLNDLTAVRNLPVRGFDYSKVVMTLIKCVYYAPGNAEFLDAQCTSLYASKKTDNEEKQSEGKKCFQSQFDRYSQIRIALFTSVFVARWICKLMLLSAAYHNANQEDDLYRSSDISDAGRFPLNISLGWVIVVPSLLFTLNFAAFFGTAPLADVLFASLGSAVQIVSFIGVLNIITPAQLTHRSSATQHYKLNHAQVGPLTFMLCVPTVVDICLASKTILCVVLQRKYVYWVLEPKSKNPHYYNPKAVSTATSVCFILCRHFLAPTCYFKILCGSDLFKNYALFDALCRTQWRGLLLSGILRFWASLFNTSYIQIGFYAADLIYMLCYCLLSHTLLLLTVRIHELKTLLLAVIRYQYAESLARTLHVIKEENAAILMKRTDDAQMFADLLRNAHHVRRTQFNYLTWPDIFPKYTKDGLVSAGSTQLPLMI